MSAQLQASITDRDTAASMTLLHFMVHDLQCCLHVQDVSRMMSLMDVQAIPGDSSYLLGMMNLHGDSVPVIDLGLRIGHQQVSPYTIDTPIILCSYKGQNIGMVVTEILEIVDCDSQALQVRPEYKESAQPYQAIVNTGDGLSLLLDIERVGGEQLGGSDIMTLLTDIELTGGAA